MKKIYLGVAGVFVSLLIFGTMLYESAERAECYDLFLSQYESYVYTSPGDKFNVTIYWCSSHNVTSRSRIVVKIPQLKVWVVYNGTLLQTGPGWYKELQVPLHVLFNHNVTLTNLSATVKILDDTKREYSLVLGNWSFEVSDHMNPLNITEYTEKVFSFNEGYSFISYKVGILNPLNTTVYVMNITYSGISGISTVAIACYNATSIFDTPELYNVKNIPKDSLLPQEGCAIPPEEERFIVMYMNITPSVKMLLIKPKIVYRIADKDKNETMAGGIMEFVRIHERCNSEGS
ncbi:hypothetical protein [Palaeococcus ferrophilus]|uniref:hypothetical protein n=1 Tax=Palaeococcus ferrophilus TaxID=83868 RepID=UPI00064EF317|nr:hypothetical protein [Palaeococcus ferrophilus]